jgi:5-methylcytosine-specific restriction endonuclease McrA
MTTTSKYFSKELNLTSYRYKQNISPKQVFYIINNQDTCQIYCNDLNVFPSNHITFENIITKIPYKKGKIYTILSVESDHFVINDQISLKSYERITWILYEPIEINEKPMKQEPIEINEKPMKQEVIEINEKPMKQEPIEIIEKPMKQESKKIKKSLPTSVKDCIWNYYIGQHINIHKCFCCKKNMIKIDDFHAGHVIAEAQGGGDDIGNLRPICSSCNSSMGKRDMTDYVKQYGLYLISPMNNLYMYDSPSTATSIPKAIRSQLWGMYISEYINEHTCCCCKKIRITIKNFEIGYVIAKKNGGADDIQNLRPICAVCKHISNDDMIETIKKYEYYI